MDAVRVLIVDDHQIVREGLKQILDLEEGVEVVGLACGGPECLDFLERNLVDLVFMDLRMPGMSGIEATRLINERHPRVKVVILTVYDEEQYLVQAMKAGAKGYVLKDAHDSELIRVIGEVAKDNAVLDPAMLTKHLESMRTPKAARAPAQEAELTPRELQVLKAIAEGLSDKEIGDKLSISEHTARTHIKSIYRKLGVGSKSQAAMVAVKRGLAPLV